MTKTLLRDVNFSSGLVPKGTALELQFAANGILTSYAGRPLRFSYTSAKLNFGKPFTQAPGIAKLEKMSDAGIATTPTGQRTEPDGIAADGSPSWLLVMGLI